MVTLSVATHQPEGIRGASAITAGTEHPEVRLTSTRVRDAGQGKLDVEGLLEATGKVVAVRFDAVVRQAGDGLQLEAAAKLDGQQLGEGGRQLGMLLPVTVHLSARLI